MSWVKGTTTYANLVSDLTKLIAGEITDGGGNTVAAGDRWIRDHAAQDLLRTPPALDLATGNVSNRAGYFAQLSQLNESASAGYVVAPTPHKTVCRQTAVWSAKPTGIGAGNRWAMMVQVVTVNTTPGDYSTGRVTIYIHDLDAAAGTTSPTIFVGNLALNSAGTITISPGGGSCTINLTNPTGTLELSSFLRSYNTAYLGGVDWHGPFYWRRTGAPTFSVNPPGTATTDFDFDVAFAGVWGKSASNTNGVSNSISAAFGWIPPGGTGQGVGIKTNTALTGALYTLSWTMASMKIRMLTNALLAPNAGQVDLEYNGCLESDGTDWQRVGNFITMSWLRAYLTPAAVTSGSLVQYWMSVKPDSIIVILNADPAQTGKLTIGGLGAFTSLKGSLDKFPWYVSGSTVDFATTASSGARFALPYTYRQLKSRQDGSESAYRDWQTGWGRCDFFGIQATTGSTSSAGVSDTDIGERNTRLVQAVGFNQNVNPASSGQTPTTVPTDSNKPNNIDGKWHLFGFMLSDRTFTGATNNEVGGIPINDDQTYRGYIGGSATTCPFWWAPGTQWSSGDEITDGVTGATWFLVAADYPGLVGRHIFTTNVGHGGLAILEST